MALTARLQDNARSDEQGRFDEITMFFLFFLQRFKRSLVDFDSFFTDMPCLFIELQVVWFWNPCAFGQDCCWCSSQCYVRWVILTWAVTPCIWWHKTSDFTYSVLNKLFPLMVFSMNPTQCYFWVRPAAFVWNWNKLFQDRLDMRNQLGHNHRWEQFKADMGLFAQQVVQPLSLMSQTWGRFHLRFLSFSISTPQMHKHWLMHHRNPVGLSTAISLQCQRSSSMIGSASFRLLSRFLQIFFDISANTSSHPIFLH